MKRVKSIALVCAILLMFLCVSCDLDCTVRNASSVSFSASVSKSLNECSSAEITTETNVNQYYWLYYAGPDEPGDATQFTAFKDKISSDNNGNKVYSKGLGSIDTLVRGESYYFALKGYSFAIINNSGAADETMLTSENLKWYGVSDQLKINSSRMNITLAVAPAGMGSVKFDFSALAVNGKTTDCDWFEISIANVKDESTPAVPVISQRGIIQGDKIYFRTDSMALECGCYLVTVQQQYNINSVKSDIEKRAQVLVIQVEAGVVTTISGCLDSSVSEEANA